MITNLIKKAVVAKKERVSSMRGRDGVEFDSRLRRRRRRVRSEKKGAR